MRTYKPSASAEPRAVKSRNRRELEEIAWRRVIKNAGLALAPVLALEMAVENRNARRAMHAAAYIRRDHGDTESAGSTKDWMKGGQTATRLLENWSREAVARLIKGISVGAEYYVTKQGGVELGSNCDAGTIEELIALRLGSAYAALEGFKKGEWTRRVKRCDNPTCQKWFFDRDRKGIQIHCCRGCTNAHGQLRRSKDYKRRRANREYEVSGCRRC